MPRESKQTEDISLRGQLLVASPALVDPNFARTVVLHHRARRRGRDGDRPQPPVRDGGRGDGPASSPRSPAASRSSSAARCSREALVCSREFTDPEAAAWIVVADVGLASADVDLDELAEAVRRGRVYAGYSGWGAGQLEAEIGDDAWIVEPPLPEELFPDDPATLWSDVLARKGGQYALIARMPEDPSQN